MQFEIICRVCLKDSSLKPIFDTNKNDDGEMASCADMLMACAEVTVRESDGLPGQICHQCFKKLCSAYKFRRLCEKSFTYLLNYNTDNNSIICEIKEENNEDSSYTSIEQGVINVKNENSQKDGTEEYLKNENDDCVKTENNNKLNNNNVNEEVDNDTPLDELLHSPKYDTDEEYIERKLQNKKLKIKYKKTKNFVSKEAGHSTKIPRFSCSFCPKVFKKTYLLITHQDSHMGIKRYFCDVCKKSYRSEKDHKKMHNRGFTFKCDICSKFFNTRAKLTIHTETHNSNREKIICGLDGCTKVFVTIGGLDRHRSLHDGLKNFVCHLCSKKFIDKYLLEIHVRRHTNERLYPCSYCDKRFYQSSARLAHERRHTNTRNFLCSQCDKSFVCSSGLKRHKLCHSKDLLEVCRFCGKKFSRCDNRKRHEIVMHGISGNTEDCNLLVK